MTLHNDPIAEAFDSHCELRFWAAKVWTIKRRLEVGFYNDASEQELKSVERQSTFYGKRGTAADLRLAEAIKRIHIKCVLFVFWNMANFKLQ